MFLHLVHAGSTQATGATLALIAASQDRLPHGPQHTLLLGGESLKQSARAAGLTQATVLSVPAGNPIWAYPALRTWLKSSGLAPTLIHAWSPGMLTLAALLRPRTPRALTLTVPPTARQAHWLRFFTRETSTAGIATAIFTLSHTIRRELLSHGVTPASVHTLRPAIDMGLLDLATRTGLRTAWSADARDIVVALLSDPPEAADALPGMMTVGLAEEVLAAQGRRVRLLVHPRQLHRRRAKAVARGVGKPHSLIDEPRLDHPWSVLPGCDFALALGPHAGGLSLLWAMAAGVPILSEARYAVSEIVEDRHTALLTKPETPSALAYRLTQLVADPALARRLSDAARSEAFSYFARSRYVSDLAVVYGQLTEGRKLEVPDLPVTGGLRFALPQG